MRAQARAGKRAPRAIHDLRAELDAMRLIKDAAELATMQRAADIASAGHARAMRACRPGVRRIRTGSRADLRIPQAAAADAHAYTPIVAGGANACVLHYVENNKPAATTATLVLIDAGCELDGYASDITRSFPVNGRFNGRAEGRVRTRPRRAGRRPSPRPPPAATSWKPPRRRRARAGPGLARPRACSRAASTACSNQADYRRFYMHRTGHWLGLDVHDAGEYKLGGDWRPLQPGMTCSPSSPASTSARPTTCPRRFWNIGIRIEDDVRVTATGCDIYTTAPKTVAEIEEVMRHD